MSLRAEWVRYGEGGRQSAFQCVLERAAGPLPGVVLIQEIWGVDAHIEQVASRLAYAGYLVLAPDLLAQGGERPPELARERVADLKAFVDGMPPAGWRDPEVRAQALAKLADPKRSRVSATLATLFDNPQTRELDRYLPALREAVRYLRHEQQQTREQRVASWGFCMGGSLSALLACGEPELSATVVFYGASPAPGLAKHADVPMLGFYGGLDERVNASLPAFANAMDAAGKSFEAYVYPTAGHAFFNDTRPSYHLPSARDAWVRALAFLLRHLPVEAPTAAWKPQG